MSKRYAPKFLIEIMMWALTLVIFLPLYFILVNSLKDGMEVSAMSIGLPSVFHWENYLEVFRTGDIGPAFMNSLIFSFGSIIICSVLSAMASYIIVRRKSRINAIIFNLFLIGLIAPMNMVTTFQFMKALHFINTYHGLILLYAAYFMPFTIFLYNGFIRNLPVDLDEAATIDGAGPLYRFFVVIFPLIKSVTVTALVINFVNCWNDFMFPLYFVTQTDKWGVVLLLFQFTGTFYGQDQLLFASALVIMVPTLIVYLFGQKYIISGMTAGAVKG
ncbi:carbohydrate ABC transporter permease [Paenibacillus sp. ACRRY]|uniref:carbohydrate ABC transporter permease n=1 Tax=Paenibacillus TaxID=44249 RepID=UPI001EF69C28|nr:carbohydrate ABC transporter permease [Paenibacillus sp. ACRRY]MCG7381690.1 carbohydrate ABC transporter permease [Paenibacillus sp. ACRRY]